MRWQSFVLFRDVYLYFQKIVIVIVFSVCDEDFCYEVHLHVLLHSRTDADLVLHKFDKNGEING